MCFLHTNSFDCRGNRSEHKQRLEDFVDNQPERRNTRRSPPNRYDNENRGNNSRNRDFDNDYPALNEDSSRNESGRYNESRGGNRHRNTRSDEDDRANRRNYDNDRSKDSYRREDDNPRFNNSSDRRDNRSYQQRDNRSYDRQDSNNDRQNNKSYDRQDSYNERQNDTGYNRRDNSGYDRRDNNSYRGRDNDRPRRNNYDSGMNDDEDRSRRNVPSYSRSDGPNRLSNRGVGRGFARGDRGRGRSYTDMRDNVHNRKNRERDFPPRFQKQLSSNSVPPQEYTTGRVELHHDEQELAEYVKEYEEGIKSNVPPTEESSKETVPNVVASQTGDRKSYAKDRRGKSRSQESEEIVKDGGDGDGHTDVRQRSTAEQGDYHGQHVGQAANVPQRGGHVDMAQREARSKRYSSQRQRPSAEQGYPPEQHGQNVPASKGDSQSYFKPGECLAHFLLMLIDTQFSVSIMILSTKHYASS